MAVVNYKQELVIVHLDDTVYMDTVNGRCTQDNGIQCIHMVMHNMLKLMVTEKKVKDTKPFVEMLSKYSYFLKAELSRSIHSLNNYGRFIEYYSDVLNYGSYTIRIRLSMKMERGC